MFFLTDLHRRTEHTGFHRDIKSTDNTEPYSQQKPHLTKHSTVEIAEQSFNPNLSVKLSFVIHPCKVQRKYVNLPTRITYYDKKYITHHKLEPTTLGCYGLQARKEIKRYHH